MKNNMRGLVSGMFAIAGVTVLFGSSLALAQESGREYARVPFAFHAMQTTLPAGSYSIRVTNSTGVMQIADRKTGHSIMLQTRGRRYSSREAARLTFHRYGNEYFLSEVWMPEQTGGYTVGKSAREKELSKEPGQLALASVRLQAE